MKQKIILENTFLCSGTDEMAALSLKYLIYWMHFLSHNTVQSYCGYFSLIIFFFCLLLCFVCLAGFAIFFVVSFSLPLFIYLFCVCLWFFYLAGWLAVLFCVVWFGLFLSFFCSRNWPRGSSGGPYCGRRSQCHLHCSGVPARHSPCSCGDMRRQWPSIWHPCLWSQILRGRRVSNFIAYAFSLCTG